MKRQNSIFFMLLFAVATLNAQSSYEAMRLLDSDLTGTARFVGMGGAMSALGADVSVMGTNPAGTALYRSNDIAASLSLSTLDTEADYLGTNEACDKTFLSFDNLGVVFARELNEGSLKFMNIGINYHRRSNFRKDFAMSGGAEFIDADNNVVPLSQMYQMQALYDLSPFNMSDVTYRNYTGLKNYWLPLLGNDAWLFDEDFQPWYLPTDVCYRSEEKGGVNQIDCNVSFNFNDRIYLGLSLGLHYVDYTRYSYYGEYDAEGMIYTLHNWYETTGSGCDLKIGAIFRPFEYSPFKFGIAVHTPTWYSLTDRTSALIEGLPFEENGHTYNSSMDTRDYDNAYGDDYFVDYHLSSPWRFNVSAAYTFGNFLALDAEYEYADYSSSKMEYSDGYNMSGLEQEIKSNMKEVNTFRIGAECRVADNISLRCGYNYISAPYKKDAGKYMISTANTCTEFLNKLETNVVTLGGGFRDKNFYMDFAYVLSMQKADFYPYYDPDIVNPGASVDNTTNRLVMTIGARF